MARVSTVQFNGSNAYELLQGDFITSFPFETVNFGNIALSVQIYSFATTGKVRVKVKGFDKTGKMIVNVYQDFTPTQSNIWQILEATWEVPTEMVKGEVQLESITGTNLIAQPKAIQGTSAGAYSTNYSQQLTFITQTGLYTGTVTAHQVILVDKENLSNRLVTINNSLLSLQDREDKISTEITAHGAKISALETKEGLLSSSITSIGAGYLTLSTNTNGKIGSFTINSDYLISSSPTYEVRLSADSSLNAFQVYDKSNKKLNFMVAHNGDLYARNANITGTVVAESGTIGGWSIFPDALYKNVGDGRSVRFSGDSNRWNPFTVYASNAEQFTVDWNGKMTANNAVIKGDVTAISGKIGSFTLSNGRLTSGAGTSAITISSSDTGGFIWAGGDWNTAKFKVTRDGTLYARNADLTGKITATSGTIGGWNLTNSFIDSKSGNARVYLASHADTVSTFLGVNDSSGVTQFSVSKQGHLTANSATIKGTLQAGSIVNGQLNKTTGTHTGSTTGTHSGSLYSVGGTYKGGLVNTTGTHTGYTTGRHSGSLYSTNGNHAGSLTNTTGSHNGSLYSNVGTLAGLNYKVYEWGGVQFSSTSGVYFKANLFDVSNAFRAGGTAQFYKGMVVRGNLTYYDDLIHMSDERLKQDIEDVPQNIVDELMNVKIKRFAYKTNPNGKHFGVIAQDILSDTSRNMSDVLVKPHEGHFAVAYEQFVPLLIKKVQDQEKRIKELEEKII